MLHRLEDLDRLDAEHGLGAYPTDAKHRLPGPPAMPVDAVRPRRRTRRGRERRNHGPVLPSLLIVLVLMAFVTLRNPGVTGDRVGQVVDHLTGHDGTYEFVATTQSGRPIAWDPCEPIPFVVNPDGAPDDWEDLVEDSVAEASDASGFDFDYGGTTDDRRWDDRASGADDVAPPVLIGWASPAEVPKLEGHTAGIGGSTPQRSGEHVHFVTGIVVLDADAFDQMEITGRDDAMRLILAHELGHVLGLDHVDDAGELMNPEYVGQDGFGDGDRKGFAELHDQPCG
jgi:Matrixin